MLKSSIGRGFGEGSVGEVSRLHAGASAGKTPRQGMALAEITWSFTHSHIWHMGWKDVKTRTAEQVTYMWPFLQLGFLTAWLPQRSQTSYMAAEGSTQKVPAHKAEAVLPFTTQPQKSPSSTPTRVCSFRGSHKPTLLKGGRPRCPPPWVEECQRSGGPCFQTMFSNHN